MQIKKIRFGLAGIDVILTVVLFILLILNGNNLLDHVTQVRTEVSGFENFAAGEFDVQNPEDLAALNATLSNTDGLKSSIFSFLSTILKILMWFILITSFVKALEYKLLSRKSKYLFLLGWILLANIGILIIMILFFMLASNFTSYLGLYTATAMWVSVIIGFILASYLLMGTYTFIVKKKFNLGGYLKLHTIFVIIGIIYYYLAKFILVMPYEWMLDHGAFILYLIIISILIYIAHLIIVTEQALLLE